MTPTKLLLYAKGKKIDKQNRDSEMYNWFLVYAIPAISCGIGAAFNKDLHIEYPKQATEDVKARRNYPDSYTDEMITEDLKKFESVIVNLAVYDHSQAGEAFMASYNENGVNRTWRDRDSLFVGVFPFTKVL
jgi:hypothetical protein